MSPFGKLSWADLAKGLLMAILVAVLTYLNQQGISTNNSIADAGIAAAIAYLLKNLVTDSNNKLLGKF